MSLVRQQQRRDTTSNWDLYNPVLLDGELGLDTTVDRFKVGDGVTAWDGLPFSDKAEQIAADAARAETAADQAETITGLTGEDAAVAFLVAQQDSETARQVSAAIDADTPQTPMLWELRQMLTANLSDVRLGVSGDSTIALTVAGLPGPDDARNWLGVFLRALGGDFAAYSIVLRHKTDSANTYNAPVTIQTGTGSHTLYVDAWVQSGADTGVGFATSAVFETAFGNGLDFLWIATAHNDFYTDPAAATSIFNRVLRQAARLVASYYPACRVSVIQGNPKTPGTARYAEWFQAGRTLVMAAGTLGFDVIDLSRSFLDRVGGYASLVPDGTHPNAAGAQLLADTMLLRFRTSQRSLNPNRLRLQRDTVMVPLLGGVAVPGAGTPVVDVGAGYGAGIGVAFDATVGESWITPFVEIPYWWQALIIDVGWNSQSNGATGNAKVRVELIGQQFDPGGSNFYPLNVANGADGILALPDGSKWGQMTETGIVTAAPPMTLNGGQKRNNRLAGGEPYPFQLRVSRLATDAADTYPADILVHYVRLRQF